MSPKSVLLTTMLNLADIKQVKHNHLFDSMSENAPSSVMVALPY